MDHWREGVSEGRGGERMGADMLGERRERLDMSAGG